MNMTDSTLTTVPVTQTQAWIAFTYIAFVASLLMVVQSCITLAKTQRDAAENARLVNRVETARTEKMLLGA